MSKSVEEVNAILAHYLHLGEEEGLGDEGVLLHYDPVAAEAAEGVVLFDPRNNIPVRTPIDPLKKHLRQDDYEGVPVLQQRWVTLTASMWPPEEPTASPALGGSGGGWRLPADRLPLLAALFCGAALVICIVFAIITYRCCIMPRRDKNYGVRKSPEDGRTSNSTPSSHHIPSIRTTTTTQSAVYAEEGKGCNWGYTNRLVPAVPGQGGQWVYSTRVSNIGGRQCTQCPGLCPVPRSNSNPGNSNVNYNVRQSTSTHRGERPVSQPVQFDPCDLLLNVKRVPVPEISEFSPQGVQYASSSILDEVNTKDDGEITLKTRSLPAWVRSKPRPLSTEDDLNDLYAKVNFSKKRKNRMRNDEAAIIALSKSRSQYLHKDTDSLVDNEAVIVYDERTAL